MELAAVLADQFQSAPDRPARAAEDPRGLAVSDLRDEGPEQIVDELRLLETIVDAKSLRREGAMALQTEEALDGAAVAGAGVAALETPAAMAGRERGALLARAMRRGEAHGSSFLPRRGRGSRVTGATGGTACGGGENSEKPSEARRPSDNGGGQIP